MPDPFYEVIGVVENTKYRSLREPLGPQMFLAASQETDPGPFLTVMLRTDGDPNALRAGLARTIGTAHPAIVLSYTVMSEQVRGSLLRETMMATLSSGFAGTRGRARGSRTVRPHGVRRGAPPE